jgi:hypothetical protein
VGCPLAITTECREPFYASIHNNNTPVCLSLKPQKLIRFKINLINKLWWLRFSKDVGIEVLCQGVQLRA